MKTQHIVGTLLPKEEQVITIELRHKIHEALVATGLVPVISADRCGWDNAVAINNTTPTLNGNHAPLEFISKLDGFLWRVNAAGLQLNGEITVTVTGVDPVVYRVVVEDSKLRYKQATLSWNQELSTI